MKCKYCGRETIGNSRVCHKCLMDWLTMRKQIWDYHENKYGKLTAENLKIRQKETRKLDRLWRKDPDIRELMRITKVL